MEHVGRLQVFNSLLNISPGRILREDGPGHDFEPSLGRPPDQWPVLLEQRLVDTGRPPLSFMPGMIDVLGHDLEFNRWRGTAVPPGRSTTRPVYPGVANPANEAGQSGFGSVG